VRPIWFSRSSDAAYEMMRSIAVPQEEVSLIDTTAKIEVSDGSAMIDAASMQGVFDSCHGSSSDRLIGAYTVHNLTVDR
jgi:hypothetical protein